MAAQSPVPLVVLLASIYEFFVDWRYKRKGGKRPSKTDYLILGIILIVVFGGITVLNYLNYNAEILVLAAVPLAIAIFGIWEFSSCASAIRTPCRRNQMPMSRCWPVSIRVASFYAFGKRKEPGKVRQSPAPLPSPASIVTR